MTFDAEQPDAFARAVHAEERRRHGRALSILTAVAAVGVVSAAGVTVLVPDWLWVNLVGASLVVMVTGAIALGWPEYAPPRPRPETPPKVGQVLGCVVRHWSNNGDNIVRVYLRACDGPETLLHGNIVVPHDRTADVPVGTMLAFRRIPGRRHLVWLAGEAPPEDLVVAATAADPQSAEALLAHGTRGTGRVTSVVVGDPTVDGRWRLDVALALPDGTDCRTRCVLAAEQLGSVAVGTELSIVYRKRIGGPADGAVILPTATVRPDN